MTTASQYADSEAEYFPEHWDEKTKKLVRFMIMEAFNGGYNSCHARQREIEKLQGEGESRQ